MGRSLITQQQYPLALDALTDYAAGELPHGAPLFDRGGNDGPVFFAGLGAWRAGGALATARNSLTGCDTKWASRACGGYNGSILTTTEEYDGSYVATTQEYTKQGYVEI